MAIAFGRGKREEAEPEKPTLPPTALNPHLVKELQSAAEKDFTGSIEVVDKGSGASARVYLYNGGLYAVTLDGYQPPLAARLQASGVLDESRVDYLAGVDRPGPEAVRLNWLSADQLATVHQEYVLASLGAVLACAKAKIHTHKGDVTDAFCTLPLPVAPLLESVQVRGQRLTSTWPGLTTDALPSTATVWVTGVPLPPTLKLPELASLRGVADGRRTVDEVAEAIGFTRAEAVHLIGMLVTAGVLRVDALADAVVPTDRYLVPEAFGAPGVTPTRRAVQPAATPAVPVATVAAVVEQVVVEPEPEPVVEIIEPEPVVETVEPEPEPVVEIIEPEPEPEPVVEIVEPEPEPEPEPVPVPVPSPAHGAPDDHVVALRRELAEAEVAELTEALADAVRAEREAISAAASVRARLLQAKQELVELGGTPTDEGA